MHKKNIHDHFIEECERRLAFHGVPWLMDIRPQTDADGTKLFGKPVIRQADTATVQRKN